MRGFRGANVSEQHKNGLKARPITAAVVLAAGKGERFGRRKQFELIDGVALVDRVLATAQHVCDHVILVLPADHEPESGATELEWGDGSLHRVVHGGGSHGASAWNGLSVVPDDVDIVLLASTSHPLAGPDLFRRTIQAVADGADAAAPMALLADAIKQHDRGRVIRSVPKTDLAMAQSPCAFNRSLLVTAYERLKADDAPLPPEELEMIEWFGGTVVLVDGEPTNIHVTTPTDLEMASRLADLVPNHVSDRQRSGQNADRMVQRSGNAGWNSVERR